MNYIVLYSLNINHSKYQSSICLSIYSCFTCFTGFIIPTLSAIIFKTSVKNRVPENTNIVPHQCMNVKEFRKYKIENMREKNFRRVIIRVTTNDGHSVVSVNTPVIHIYLWVWSRKVNYI